MPHYRSNIILLGLFFAHLLLLWPGFLSPDSQTQYQMAITGVYTDHHPFIMSFIWRYLDKIYQGPVLMLTMHLVLLYGSVYFLKKSLPNTSKLRNLFLIYPFIPHVFSYSGMIWKDVGCAYSFLFVVSYLTYCTLRHTSLNLPKTLGILIVLAYGTLVKFQAQYLAPIVLVWISYHQTEKVISWPFLKKAMIVFSLFYGMIGGLKYFSPPITEQHSWQMVKLYDLAALSVSIDHPLFPEFSKTSRYSREELHKRFNHERVDDLIYIDPILKAGKTPEERDLLWKTWTLNVLQHPIIYAKHRTLNLAYALLSPPLFRYVEGPVLSLPYPFNNIGYVVAKVIGYVVLSHLLPMLMSLFYVLLAFLTFHRTRAATPLLFSNSLSLAMGLALFFFSMAGTPRYTYIVVCLFHASHPFAYECFKAWRSKPALTT